MLIFLNEDRAYQNWVTHHRLGFVLDGHRKPRFSHLVLHRADCPEVRVSPSKRHHWTTGNRLKACSLDLRELETWASDETGKATNHCPHCRPAEERAAEPVHLTRLGRDVLDYVLDAAVIHMEHEHPPYRLTVHDIAACFAKTPGQLGPVLQVLVEQGMVSISGKQTNASVFSAKQIVFPTIAALRTLESLRDEPESGLQQELAKLQAE